MCAHVQACMLQGKLINGNIGRLIGEEQQNLEQAYILIHK